MNSQVTPGIRRRSIATGLAWATPAIIAGAAAPAYAASCNQSCSSINSRLAFGTAINANGWSNSLKSGTFSGDQAAVFISSWNSTNMTTNCSGAARKCGTAAGTRTNIVLFGGDPSSTPTAAYITYRSGTFCLKNDTKYVFSFVYIDKACVGNAVTISANLIASGGASTTLGSFTSIGPASSTGTITCPSFTPAVDGTYQFEFRWTFAAKTWTRCDYNDVGVQAPTVTCA